MSETNVENATESKSAPNAGSVKIRERLHTHPGMEKRLGVPEDHVIIDRDMFEKLFRHVGGMFPKWD